jgi:hypothetical protein
MNFSPFLLNSASLQVTDRSFAAAHGDKCVEKVVLSMKISAGIPSVPAAPLCAHTPAGLKREGR